MKVKNLHAKILGLSTFKQILLMVALMFLTQIIIIPELLMFPSEAIFGEMTMLDYSKTSKMILQIIDYCIATPLIFTLISQSLIIGLMWKFFFKTKNTYGIVIPMIVSALFFAFLHGFSLNFSTYLISNFILGLILAYSYIVFYLSDRKPILYTTCVHSALYVFFIVIDMASYFFS